MTRNEEPEAAMYVTLQGRTRQDFSYDATGTYRRPSASGFFRSAARAEARRGRVCLACGCERSVAGKCECNS